ncbi:MAG: phytanoyl-CoA dioxygenase family protein [Bryobacterales bacterium]|nr:phytanoyl-CoA dioxygenase family protein [Bryobacterales bacterium]MDE0625380.1 phytanoyl-CoA dioxygenase family protein [Bryobacterales bacterium]
MCSGVPDVETAVEELCNGQGYLLLEDFFPRELVAEARERIYRRVEEEPARTSHFYGDEVNAAQARVWNLPAKGQVFRDLCADERMLALMRPILGDDLMLSSFAANVLHPGAQAQEPHVDYPYWDLHARKRWPRALNASYHLAVESVIPLDEFTVDNGATAIVPGSQKLACWPDPAEFAARQIRAIMRPGALLLFPALLWHAGQTNRSGASRATLLGSYTIKSIKPIEDWSRCIRRDEALGYDETMQGLLGVNYPYPAVMDALPGRSSEGARSRESILSEGEAGNGAN